MNVDLGSGLSSRQPDTLRVDVREKYAPDIVADVQSLSFKSTCFQTAYLDNVLEHLERPLEALKEAHRVAHTVVAIVPTWYHHTAWYMGVGGTGGRHKQLYIKKRFVRIPGIFVFLHIYWFLFSSSNSLGRKVQRFYFGRLDLPEFFTQIPTEERYCLQRGKEI